MSVIRVCVMVLMGILGAGPARAAGQGAAPAAPATTAPPATNRPPTPVRDPRTPGQFVESEATAIAP